MARGISRQKPKQKEATRGETQGLKGCDEWVEGAAKGNKQGRVWRPDRQEQRAAKSRCNQQHKAA